MITKLTPGARKAPIWLPALAALLVCLPTCAQDARTPVGASKQAAHFKILNEVVNPDVQPFTATITGFGNSLFSTGSGFEPVIFRNKYIATQDSADRVYARPEDLSHWDTYREGMLDGAQVRVYRIEDGRFKLVRNDSVAAGGFHVSGWNALVAQGSVVAADQPSYRFRWNDYNRPSVPYYFAVRAIDAAGQVSPVSNVVSIVRPDKTGAGEVANTLKPFKNTPTAQATPGKLPAPTGLKARVDDENVLRLDWDAAPDSRIAGYLVYQSDYPQQAQLGYYMQLSDSPASPSLHIKTGDMVLVEKKFYDASRTRSYSNRVWTAGSANRTLMPGLLPVFSDEDPTKSWELVKHPADTPVAEAGETFLRLHLQTGAKLAVGEYSFAGTGQSWYQVLEQKPYRVDVWLRQQGNAKITFRVPDYFGQAAHKIEPIEFSAGPEWKRFTATFTPPVIQTGTLPGRIMLDITGPGTVDVDNFRVYRDDAAYLDYTDQEYASLRQSGMQALRTHGFIKTGVRTYDLEQLTNPGGVSGGPYTGKTNTLPQTLAMLRKAGMRPWLQIEPHLSPAEWAGLVEYLAAPYNPVRDTPLSKPWAYKRFQQGQAKPWTDEFDRIYFELGNETWNRLFRPWVFDAMSDASNGTRYSAGQVYGLYQEYVGGLMRNSPYWSAAGLDKKVELVLGGWNGLRYGMDAVAASPLSRHMTVASYLGGWDAGEQALPLVPASFSNLLHYATRSGRQAEKQAKEVAELAQKTGRPLRFGTYEAGPGYALNGLNNERVTPRQADEQEQVMKSLASGVATLDVFLAQAYLGYGLQNYFTFGTGGYWTSHAPWFDGGQAYPAWKALELFNNQATGTMLATQTISVPTVEVKAPGKAAASIQSPGVAVYATRNKQRLSVFVLSRSLLGQQGTVNEGFTPVVIDLPFHSAKSLVLYRMTGDASTNNLKADNVRVEKMALDSHWPTGQIVVGPKAGADSRGLPPSSAFLYVFDGIDAASMVPPIRIGAATNP